MIDDVKMSALKLHRFLRGYSQARLAREVELDPAILSRLENNLYRDTPAVIGWKKRVAAVLNVAIGDLFPGIPEADEDR